ncbi:MAG: hypothetical protein ACYS80_02920 [Planctomycetota bacterium]
MKLLFEVVIAGYSFHFLHRTSRQAILTWYMRKALSELMRMIAAKLVNVGRYYSRASVT